jgi:hypothetical protein
VAAHPFYFVSLPIASLLAGAEMLSKILIGIYFLDIGLLIFIIGFPIFLWFENVPLAENLPVVNSMLAPFAVPFVSGFMLWLAVRRGDELKRASAARRQIRVVLLVLIFAWAFLSLRQELFALASAHIYHPRIL